MNIYFVLLFSRDFVSLWLFRIIGGGERIKLINGLFPEDLWSSDSF